MTSPASMISERNCSRHSARSNNSNLHSRGSVDSTQSRHVPPRMVINKMVLNNFKSYFGKQEIGPFHKVRYNNILLIEVFCATYSHLIAFYYIIYIYIYMASKFSRFPLLSDQMVQENQMLSM